MHRAGTLTIWRTITATYQVPPYARLYWRYQRKRESTVPHRVANGLFNACFSTSLIITLPVLMCTGVWSALSANSLTMLIVSFSGLALLPGIGVMLLASRIGWAAHTIKRQYTWDLLLMLPHPRDEVVLYAVASAYEPGPLLMSLGIVEPLALALCLWSINSSWWHVPILVFLPVAILLEWLQWIALSGSVGLLSSHQSHTNLALPVVFGVVMTLIHTGGGWIVAHLLDFPRSATLAALLLGPLSGIASPDAHLTGLVIAGIYLLAMETGVRGLFGWAVRQVNER
jgi:hypothetical protein